MKLFLLIFLLPFSSANLNENLPLPQLSELVNAKEHHQLRSMLAAIFNEQTTDHQADSTTVFEENQNDFNDRLSSISQLNFDKRDLLFQGDIHLSRRHLAEIVREQERQRRGKRGAFKNQFYPKTIWAPHVPFIYHESLSAPAKKSLAAAISFWQKNTCINFKPRTTENVFLVLSGNEAGCWSTVGRDESQKAQILNIGKGCEMFGITTHEIAHALGLFHEQSRYDRDDYVEIIKKRIAEENFDDFSMIGPNNLETYGMKYDIGSVMHYRPNEFSIDGSPTIVAKDINMKLTMGQYRQPSFLDIAKLNRHYKCDEVCKEKIKCENGGIQDSRNCQKCICPSGFGGFDCSAIEGANPKRCQGKLTASETQRQLNINIRPKKDVQELRKCVYHIEAPVGKRVVLIVDSIIGNCVQGCYEEGVEIKMYSDKTVTGARFCCALKSPQTLISQDNRIVIIAIAGKAQTFVQIRYSFVDLPMHRSQLKSNIEHFPINLLIATLRNSSMSSEEIQDKFRVQLENQDEFRDEFEKLLLKIHLNHDFL